MHRSTELRFGSFFLLNRLYTLILNVLENAVPPYLIHERRTSGVKVVICHLFFCTIVILSRKIYFEEGMRYRYLGTFSFSLRFLKMILEICLL